MKCPKCGNTNIKEGQKFCTMCGSPLPQSQNAGESPEEKGLIDNLTHFGTFMQRGSRGVQQEIRRERRERIEQDAQALGMNVVKPQQNGGNGQGGSALQRSIPRPTVDDLSIQDVDVVNGRAIWNVQKGEIARVITEREFANVDNLKGVVIQEGCSVMVFVDGEFVTTMQAGSYTFPVKSEAERQFEQMVRGFEKEQRELAKEEKEQEEKNKKETGGLLSRIGHGIGRFLLGKRDNESSESHQKRVAKTGQKLSSHLSAKSCRVYIVSTRIINVVIDNVEENGAINFAPFTVNTKVLPVEIAVSMQLQVSNLASFCSNYLTDRKSISTGDVVGMIAPGVKSAVSMMLRNLDYQQDGLPDAVVSNLKNRIQGVVNDILQGIEVVKVLEVTDSSKVFDRFRAVAAELFATKQEIEDLHKVNDFRNMLEQEENRRTVQEAGNKEELRQALQAIDKDRLLSEDQMAEFVMLLDSQKRLREAKTKEEEYEAISDLRKNHLIKDDDVAALQNSLQQGEITRDNVTALMRVQAAQKLNMAQQIADFELSDNELEHEIANEMRKARHEGELTASQLETQKLIDSYMEEKLRRDDQYEFDMERRRSDADFSDHVREDDYEWEKAKREEQMRREREELEYKREREAKFDRVELMSKESEISSRLMREMNEASMAKDKQQQDYLLASQDKANDMEKYRLTTESHMTQEQIAASHMKDIAGLDAEAQKAMAEMMGSKKANDTEKAMYERMLTMMQENQTGQKQSSDANQAQMMEMMKMMMAGMAQASQAGMMNQQQRYDDLEKMKNEYRENMMHQQDRVDRNTEQSLDFTTRAHQADSQSFAQAMGGYPRGFQPGKPQTAGALECPVCHEPVSESDAFCPSCCTRLK